MKQAQPNLHSRSSRERTDVSLPKPVVRCVKSIAPDGPLFACLLEALAEA